MSVAVMFNLAEMLAEELGCSGSMMHQTPACREHIDWWVAPSLRPDAHI